MNDNYRDTKKVEGIEDEFQDTALKLKHYDFSQSSNEKKVYDKLIKNYEKSESMRKSNKLKRCSVAALIIAASGLFISQSTYAKGAVADFINKVSLGSITIYQDNLEGKNPDDYKVLYDESGKEVDKETIEKGGTFYAKNGEEIKVEGNSEEKVIDKLIVTDTKQINNYTCFNVNLPSYLPEGYKFKQAEFYKDEEGAVKDSKYADLTFVNSDTGDEFYIQERKDCEETRYSMSTSGKVEKIKINGVDAALSDGKNIDWVNDNNIYALMGKNLNRDEVIKVAESIK